jgi:hypothetical protein
MLGGLSKRRFLHPAFCWMWEEAGEGRKEGKITVDQHQIGSRGSRRGAEEAGEKAGGEEGGPKVARHRAFTTAPACRLETGEARERAQACSHAL